MLGLFCWADLFVESGAKKYIHNRLTFCFFFLIQWFYIKACGRVCEQKTKQK